MRFLEGVHSFLSHFLKHIDIFYSFPLVMYSRVWNKRTPKTQSSALFRSNRTDALC